MNFKQKRFGNYVVEMKGADMQEVELKPCPFCGGKAVVKATTKRIGFVIWCECEKCYAKTEGYCPNIENENTSITSIERCKNDAIELWNRRV